MIETAMWLGVLGLCDLLRAARDATSARRRGALVVLGLSLLVIVWLVSLGVDGFDGLRWLVLAGWLVGLPAWVVGSGLALNGEQKVRTWRWVGFAGVGVGTAVSVVADLSIVDTSSFFCFQQCRGLPPSVEQLGVVLVGVALWLVSTANVLVRLLLDAVGVPAGVNERRLKGGRVLGPMERVFILVLGLQGGLAVAFVVVAAKGLLRFPELRASDPGGGPDVGGPSELTEYFLIGSFASWVLALLGVAVLQLSAAVTEPVFLAASM